MHSTTESAGSSAMGADHDILVRLAGVTKAYARGSERPVILNNLSIDIKWQSPAQLWQSWGNPAAR